jgi:carboxyl-terminal processing protease
MCRSQTAAWFPAFLFSLTIGFFLVPQLTADDSQTLPPGSERLNSEEELEMLRLFIDTYEQVRTNYVDEVSERELMEAAIRGMISKLDPHSGYISPQDLDRFRVGVESEFGGIGIQVSTEDGALRVISPLVGTPAYRAGILAGDTILEIDGESTRGITIDEAVHLMQGPGGNAVRLKVMSEGDSDVRELTLEREVIRIETVMGDRRDENDAWDFMLDDEHKIGYIRMTAFSRHTTGELQTALKDLQRRGMKGLILDLRNNPGGLLSTAIEVSDLFISEGEIVRTAGRNVRDRVWNAGQHGTFDDFPMAVLVNRVSASGSEIVAACLQDHERAVVVGERTWGKASVQNIVELEEGRSALKLTTAGYQRPQGQNIHRFPDADESDDWGVIPDEPYQLRLNPREFERLARARRQRDILRSGDEEEKEALEENEVEDRQRQLAVDYLLNQLGKKESQIKTVKAETESESG